MQRTFITKRKARITFCAYAVPPFEAAMGKEPTLGLPRRQLGLN